MRETFPIQKYMLHNMTASSEETKETLTYRAMRKVVKRTLCEIGFMLKNPHAIVDSFGLMPDQEASSDHRYWATFQVDSKTALEIFDQRKGRNKKILELNRTRCKSSRSFKYLKFKQYRGVKYEAILATLRKVVKIMSHEELYRRDRFKLSVGKTTISMKHRDCEEETTLELRNVINDYPKVFEKAVQSLPDTFQEIMREFQNSLRVEKQKKTLPASPEESLRRRHHYPLTPPTIGPYGPCSSPSANVTVDL